MRISIGIIYLFSLFFTQSSWAKKINFDFGFFNITAKPPSSSGSAARKGTLSLSGPGAYSLSGSIPVLPSLELGAGYTIFYSDFISGDMGFGPDFFVSWFPLNEGSGSSVEAYDLKYYEIQKFRPFVHASFHQRQFQSSDSSFSGFGFGGGLEMSLDANKSVRATLRSMSLVGSSQSTFDYMDVLIGFQFNFR